MDMSKKFCHLCQYGSGSPGFIFFPFKIRHHSRRSSAYTEENGESKQLSLQLKWRKTEYQAYLFPFTFSPCRQGRFYLQPGWRIKKNTAYFIWEFIIECYLYWIQIYFSRHPFVLGLRRQYFHNECPCQFSCRRYRLSLVCLCFIRVSHKRWFYFSCLPFQIKWKQFLSTNSIF